VKRVVLVVRDNGETALVQWLDGERSRRAFVPSAEVAGGSCSEEALAQGVAVGADWESLTKGVSPVALAEGLRRHGVWTLGDLQAHWGVAQKAACKVATECLITMLEEAKRDA